MSGAARASRPGRASRPSRAAARAPKGSRQRSMSLPAGLHWRHVHPITPLARGWRVVATVFAIIAWQAVDDIKHAIELYRQLREVDPAQYSETVQAWATEASGGDPTTWLIGAGIVLGLIVLAILTIPFLSWRAMTYAVDADAVYLRTGILAKQLRIARLPRIQSLDITHPLLGRIVGLGQLSVEVAGGSDSKVLIGYLRTRQLGALRREILELAAGATTSASSGTLPGDGATGVGAGASGPAGGPTEIKGFEDIVGAPRIAEGTLEEAEHPLYVVDTGILIRSLLRSGPVILLLIAVPLYAGLLIALAWHAGTDAALDLLPTAIAIPLALVPVVWNTLSQGWGFRAAATPAGIRMRYGLTDATSMTLPPGRVHAVGISQSLLWRRKDWWRADAALAGRALSKSEAAQGNPTKRLTRLLPVGARDQALRALWLVIPDLGVPDPDRRLDSALTGIDDGGAGPAAAPIGAPERGFISVPRRARLFNPSAWRRKAIARTDTCVILRLNRWSRRVNVIPYERIQSYRVTAGPLARRRGLATLRFDTVDILFPIRISNLDAAATAEISGLIAARAARRGRDEHLDRWLARVTEGVA